ncbi:MAG: helix-turn-helix transcriptional regulator [Actinomycetales bacterium]|nr:helix-turn-helix transcriptional regulator [Actinomycetales bacterium]
MSVRQGILVLLAEQGMHVSQLKAEFEARTGGAWPVNIGQVFTTLQRLERDGLVEKVPHQGAAEPERFRATAAGAAEASAWWSRPVERGAPARDELAIKLALAVTARGVDVQAVVQAQRTETMRALHDYTRLKMGGRPAAATERTAPAARGADAEPAEPVRATAPPPASAHGGSDELAWSLVLDHLVFATEAEVRWLDHVETRVARAAAEQRPDGTPSGAGRTASAQGADAAPPPSTGPAGPSGAGATPAAPTGAGDAWSAR